MRRSWRPRPGDVVFRRPVLRPEMIMVPIRAVRRPSLPVAAWLAMGFGGLILMGTILLMLPVANAAGRWTPVSDALFTATSAVCVTGLVVVDTGTFWSPFGKVVILALIQMGGLGFMTGATLLMLAIGHRVTLRERMRLTQSLGATRLGGVVWFVRRILLFTVATEAVGAVFLGFRFAQYEPWPTAVWQGVFHSISAFNNAGFALFSTSLEGFARDPGILLTVAALVMVGGIGFTFLVDVFTVRRFHRLTLDSKIVLVVSALLWLVGMGMVFVTEFANPATLSQMDAPERVLNGFFMSVMPRTAGFNSVNVGLLRDYTLLFLMLLMFIGAASGSTGGGIKVSTFGLVAVAAWGAILGKPRVQLFGREVPESQVHRALAVGMMGGAIVFVVTLLLTMTEKHTLLPLLFEATSAFGTVGLSTGITGDLTLPGQLLIILTMFLGRLGPLTLALSLAERVQKTDYRFPEEEIKLG